MSVHHVRNWADLVCQIEKAGVPCIIDITADWCPPSRAIAPTYEKLAKQYPSLRFLKVEDNRAGGKEAIVRRTPRLIT